MRIELNIQLFADGKVTIETDLNDKGFKSGLDKMKSIASTGFKAIATSVGVAATAITGLIAKSVQAAGELEQQMGGTKAVFGDFADVVEDKAKKAFDKMGVSANDFMATANKMGALMQGSGISIEDSMELSTAAMQRAADVASIMGIDISSAMDSIAGAAKGNFTMMDNLGVAMNATTIEAYAMSKGIKESYNEMDNATKIGLAMEMFLEKTTYAEQNYEKENDTFAGSLNTLKAAFSNFLSGAGGIEDVSSALVRFSGILIKSIGETAPTITKGIVDVTKKIIPEIPKIINQLLPIVLDGAISLINSLTEIFPAFITMIEENSQTIIDGALLIIDTLVKGLISMAPQLLEMGSKLIIQLMLGLAEKAPDLVPEIINIIIKMLEVFNENFDKFLLAGVQLILGLIEGLIKSIPDILANLPTILLAILNFFTATKLIGAGKTLLKGLGSGLIEAIPNLIKNIPKIITNMVNAFKEKGLGAFADIGLNLVKGLWEGISNATAWVLDKIKGFGKAILNGIKGIFGIHSPSTVFRDEVGKFLAEGIGVGFEDELDNVYNDMQKAIDLETDKMTANVQTNGTYQMAMAGVPEFNLLDNSTQQIQLVANGKVLADVVNTENRNREVARA